MWKIKYLWEQQQEKGVDYLSTYAYTTQKQSFTLENKVYTIPKNQLYHISTSRKFKKSCVQSFAHKYNLHIVDVLTTKANRMHLFILQKQ